MFVLLAVASYVVGDWMVYVALGWFAVWEAYGIATPRSDDTYSEQNWKFTADKPARLGLTLGLVGYFSLTLLRLAFQVVYGDGDRVVWTGDIELDAAAHGVSAQIHSGAGGVTARDIADFMKFMGAAVFVGLSTGWLCLHFILLGRKG